MFIKFTKPGGGVTEINPDQVEGFREVEPGEFHPLARTLILLVSGQQAVRETLDVVEKALTGRLKEQQASL